MERKFSSNLEIPKYLKRKENFIVIDCMQKVDAPVGKRYIQISEDVLYDIYHGRLPVFFVEDICNDKYVT